MERWFFLNAFEKEKNVLDFYGVIISGMPFFLLWIKNEKHKIVLDHLALSGFFSSYSWIAIHWIETRFWPDSALQSGSIWKFVQDIFYSVLATKLGIILFISFHILFSQKGFAWEVEIRGVTYFEPK